MLIVIAAAAMLFKLYNSSRLVAQLSGKLGHSFSLYLSFTVFSTLGCLLLPLSLSLVLLLLLFEQFFGGVATVVAALPRWQRRFASFFSVSSASISITRFDFLKICFRVIDAMHVGMFATVECRV